MKKNLFYCLFAASCAVTALSSCSEDYEPTPNLIQAIERDVAGDYKGTLSVEVDGISFEPTSQNIVIERSGMNRVDLTISNFSFANMPLGDVTLADCILEKKGDTYTFQRTEELTLADPVGTCPVSSAATIAKEKVEVTLDITVPALNNQKVNVVYEGTRLTGSENTEAKILSFTFDPSVEANAVVISEPVIDEAAKTISFDVTPDGDVTALVPVVTVSEGATLSPASGEAQNFSSPVTYTVLSEDGRTSVTYTVSIASLMNKYDFEEWVAGVEGQGPDMTFYEPVGWSSSNAGVQFLKGFGMADSYVVMETGDAHSGSKAALIKSIDSKGRDMYIAKVPKVTTGSLFLGSFITDISSTLNSTKFGIPYSNKPVSLKGWYKYTPGPEYYIVNAEPYDQHCHEAVLDNTKTDEFMISAVLYETDEYDLEGWTDCLTGVADAENNIYNSSRIAAIAQLTGGEQVDWKEFNLELEWKKEYDVNAKYRFAIICSSSKDGDKFWGAPESTLIVDDFELVVE